MDKEVTSSEGNTIIASSSNFRRERQRNALNTNPSEVTEEMKYIFLPT